MTEFHKRSSRSRKNQEARIEKHFQKRRSAEDHKRLKAQARERRNTRAGEPPRRREWADDEDAFESTERMARRVAPAGRKSEDLPPPATDGGRQRDGHAVPPPDLEQRAGVVVSVGRGRAEVALPHELIEAQLPPGLAAVQQTELAVGDEVVITRQAGAARVASIRPRRTTLSRPDPGNTHRRRVLAANIDVAVLVLSVRRPTFKPGLVDRFLVALGDGGVRPAIIANKADLLETGAARSEVMEALAPHRALDLDVLLVSARSGEGVDALRDLLRGRRSVFVGHSGVGKSSLLNALDPAGARLTRAGREGDGKGRHTTTRSTLTALADGTEVIDTPGVRAFGLWHMDRASLRDAFPDLRAHAEGCRFRDCSHLVEPGCAVRAAVDDGQLAGSRFASYQRIHASLEE